jgi:hypothetical protein
MIPDRQPPEYRVARPTGTAAVFAGKRLVPQRLCGIAKAQAAGIAKAGAFCKDVGR